MPRRTPIENAAGPAVVAHKRTGRRSVRAGTVKRDLSSLLSERSLTPAQEERLARLREATGTLASEGGYAAVTVRAVAERAGVGLATVYRYFSSKDHLIADVTAALSHSVIAELRGDPPKGRTAAERVTKVFDRMLEVIAADLPFAAAGIAAMASGDEVASSPEYWNDEIMVAYLDTALGSDDVGDRTELAEVLGHVFFSVMAGFATGRNDLDECRRAMARAVRLVLPDSANKRSRP